MVGLHLPQSIPTESHLVSLVVFQKNIACKHCHRYRTCYIDSSLLAQKKASNPLQRMAGYLGA